MDIGVVMLVKNEANSVEAALAPILDELAEVIVYDTGSTDGTQDVLRERLRIEPLSASLDSATCSNLSSVRNRGFARLKTPWRMSLDADERLATDEFRQLRKTRVGSDVGGLFLRWRNFLADSPPFEDYKCPVFRAGLEHFGLVHDTVQPALRKAGLRAEWSDAAVLEHFPDPLKAAAKRERSRHRLRCAISRDPENPRYPWFYGYGALLRGDRAEARKWLRQAAESRHPWFPVERLNALIVLAAERASDGAVNQARTHLDRAKALLVEHSMDFEVAVNDWMGPWIDDASQRLDEGRPEAIEVPRFGY